jgi:prophage regulatory protein
VQQSLQQIYRRPEVEKCAGKKRSALYADIADGKFPAPIRLGERAVGWLESDLLTWQAARIAERDAKLPTCTEAIEHSGVNRVSHNPKKMPADRVASMAGKSIDDDARNKTNERRTQAR